MKKNVIALLIAGFAQNIDCSYRSNEDLDQAMENLQEQLIIDLQSHNQVVDLENPNQDQHTLMNNYYAAKDILFNQKLDNIERSNFEDADTHAVKYIAKYRHMKTLMENGFNLYQAEDEAEKAIIGEQAFAIKKQEMLETERNLQAFLGTSSNETFTKNFLIKETANLYKTIDFFDAGLKLSQATIACNHDLTLEQALEMQTLLQQRNGINGNNDGYKEIISQIKSRN